LSEPSVDLVGRTAVHVPTVATSRPAVLAAAPGPFLPHRARELTRGACRAWRLPHLDEPAAAVAGELVANAVVHAQTFLELHLSAEDSELVVAVHDRDPGFDPGWWDCRGDGPRGARYGLYRVRRLAHRYGGYQHAGGGKVMWAALATPPDVAADGLGDAPHAALGSPAGDRAWRPVRRRIVVNRARATPGAQRDRWRLELVLGWLPEDPDHVDISLCPTPLHPALPTGNWHARRDTLRQGVDGPAGDGAVRVHRDPAGRTVLLELAGDPPHLVQCPVHQLRAFVDSVDAATCRGQVAAAWSGPVSRACPGVPEGRHAVGLPRPHPAP